MPEAVRMVGLRKVFGVIAAIAVLVLSHSFSVNASHIKSGDITWECITSGPDAGKFIFRVRLFRDCLEGPPGPNQTLRLTNHPDHPNGFPIQLFQAAGYPIDRTDPSCGISCSSPNNSQLTLEEWVFESAPTMITGTPPSNGFQISYTQCCRGDQIDNIANSNIESVYYVATMYPYYGRDLFPCYDSSPQFAELPTTALCAGYEMRYNNNAIDSDLDSISYELAHALSENGQPVTYEAGYSSTSPVPGPNQLSLNPTTGQLTYQSPTNVSGKWTVVVAINGWRCGQRISRIIREMNVTIVPCSNNSPPQVGQPNWTSPAGTSGYSVTVPHGSPVSFSLTASDNDLNSGVAQTISFSATGSQLSTSTDCIAPCAQLSNVSPPFSGTGSVSTTFDWTPTCNHVNTIEECGNLTSTHNFIFTFKDDFCPARGITSVNVSVTVLGDAIVNSPDPRCVNTEPSGDITLSWVPVVDNAVPPSFVEYVIYHSTSPNGPYQEIGAVSNISTGTYQHTAANPVVAPTTSGPNYYLIRTRSGCGGNSVEAPVDTVSSIYLTLNNTGTMAELSWTPVATPPRPTSASSYTIYQEYPAGTWTQIASTSNLSYSVPVIWCNEWVNFRVELSDDLPCNSVSNVAGDLLDNPATPDPQSIDSVTVINELARISWSPNGQTNVIEYIVEQNNNGIWSPMYVASGYTNTDWINPNSNASVQSEIYRVKAKNNCLETGDPVLFHWTILATVVADKCDRFTEIEWNEYVNWPEGVGQYEIHASKDGGTESLVGTVADTVTFFKHENLDTEATYCYRVVAVRNTSNRVTSTSNDTCVFIYVPKRPDYQYNYNTTVQPGNAGVDEYFFVDSTAGYVGFEIQRGETLESLSYTWFTPFDPTTRYYQYNDAGARPQFRSYYYMIIGIDSCQLNADTMNVSRTIFLEAEANADRTNDLQWNAYEGWNSDVTGYNLYRQIGGLGGTFDYLATLPANQLTYTDTVQEIIVGDGNFCYYVEAVQDVGAPVGPQVAPPPPEFFQEVSRSNDACAHQHPNVFVPNAFMPEGVNNTFKPINVYVDFDNYLLRIFNRWGGLVFQTTDPNEGWNGSNGGKYQPQGAYVYYVQFVSSSGESYNKSGTVTLIR